MSCSLANVPNILPPTSEDRSEPDHPRESHLNNLLSHVFMQKFAPPVVPRPIEAQASWCSRSNQRMNLTGFFHDRFPNLKRFFFTQVPSSVFLQALFVFQSIESGDLLIFFSLSLSLSLSSRPSAWNFFFRAFFCPKCSQVRKGEKGWPKNRSLSFHGMFFLGNSCNSPWIAWSESNVNCRKFFQVHLSTLAPGYM